MTLLDEYRAGRKPGPYYQFIDQEKIALLAPTYVASATTRSQPFMIMFNRSRPSVRLSFLEIDALFEAISFWREESYVI